MLVKIRRFHLASDGVINSEISIWEVEDGTFNLKTGHTIQV